MILTRRSFMQSILALSAAPAIVRADSLMRVVPIALPVQTSGFIAPAGPMCQVTLEEFAGFVPKFIDVTQLLDTAPQYAYGLMDRHYRDRTFYAPLHEVEANYDVQETCWSVDGPIRVRARTRMEPEWTAQ